MPRSLKVNQDCIGTVKLALKRRGFLSQRALSEELGLALSTVSNFMNGKPTDRAIFEEICTKLALNWQDIAALGGEESSQPVQKTPSEVPIPEVPTSITANVDQDWGEAPDSITFYGRNPELVLLEKWIIHDRCRFVLILGIGGAGKTALSVKLLEQIGDRFDVFIWRSLQNAPPLPTLLNDVILSLSHQQAILFDRLDVQLATLMDLLRQRRCLWVLDNAESILQSGVSGQYQDGYEAYDELFCRVADGRHQSSLIVTSREQPRSLALRVGEQTPVRSLVLNGLQSAESQQILAAKGLIDSDRSFQKLVQIYCGNPLAIKIAAATIQSAFSGNIDQFLQQQVVAYGGIWDLLNQQFDRLSSIEQQVMYWIAIEREWITCADLYEHWILPIEQRQLIEALESLQGRSLIEAGKPGFTQQPVVMEYVTQKLIDGCHQEITDQRLHLLKCHALLNAQTKNYIRETQTRLILKPLVQKLLATLNGKITVEFIFDQLLDGLRGKPLSYTGYAAGNLINLLIALEVDLSDRNFSELAIAHAYLTESNLQRTNFTDATIHKSAFIETLGGIVSVAFSPDGQLLAASDTRGEIHVWQIHDKRKLLTLHGHHSWVFSLVFSPNTRTLASGSDDYIVKLWNITTGECLQTLRGPANIHNAIAFSADEQQILIDPRNAAIRFWDVESPAAQLHALQGHIHFARSMAFSPDGKTVANATQDHQIKLWNICTGECEKTFQPEHSMIRLVTYSPNGQYLASTSYLNATIQLLDLTTNQYVHSLEGHTQSINEIIFSPDSCYLASSGYDQTVKIWDVATGQCLRTLYGHSKKLMTVAFSPDGQQVASGGDDHIIKLWDLHSGQCIKTFQGYTNVVPAIALSLDQRTLASAHEDMTIKLWDLCSGQVAKTLPTQKDLIWAIAFSPCGQLLASAHADRIIKLWNLHTGTCLTATGHHNWVWSIAFHPQGQIFATGSYDETIKLWDTQTGACLRTLAEHLSAVQCVCFSPDGNLLASAGFNPKIQLWDVNTGLCVHTLQGHRDRVWQVAFSADGRLLASCSHDRTIKLWDWQTGACLKTLTGHQGAITSVCFSPDHRQLASGSFDQTLKIWDVATGKCLQTLSGHASGVLSVLFYWGDEVGEVVDKEGDRLPLLISSSFDGTIKVWNPETGVCLKTLIAPRPYEGMNITGLVGLTEAQRLTLKELGAIALPQI